MQHKCRGCGLFIPEREIYSPDEGIILCKNCYMAHFAAESSKGPAPVEVVNNREGFFDEKQDREYFGFGFIAGGILVAVFGTILGNILSELVLDEMRVNKFGYRSNDEGSFWKLGE